MSLGLVKGQARSFPLARRFPGRFAPWFFSRPSAGEHRITNPIVLEIIQ